MTVSTKSDLEFSIGDSVVYPAHGVGAVVGVETQEVAGYALEAVSYTHLDVYKRQRSRNPRRGKA